MAFPTAESRSEIIALVVTMLNRAPDNALLDELVTAYTGGASIADIADHIAASDEFVAANSASQTAEEYAAAALDRAFQGATVAADLRTAAIDLAVTYLNDGMTKAGLALEINKFLSNPDVLVNPDQADFANIAQAFINKNTVAEYYVLDADLGDLTAAELAAAIASVTDEADSVTAATDAADATAAAEEVVPGQTFTLTTGLDLAGDFEANSGSDEFIALDVDAEAGVADASTFNTGDEVDGKGGIDTLVIKASANAAGTASVTTTNVERLSIYNNSTDDTYDIEADLMAGLTDVYINGGNAATEVTGLDSLVNLHLISTNEDATLAFAAGVTTGTADEVTILANRVATSTAVEVTYPGVETINLVAAGTTGSLTATTNRSLEFTAAALETMNVSGDADIYVTTTFSGAEADTQTSTFDASAAGGKVTANLTKGTSELVSITMSAQDDYLAYNSALTEDATLIGGEGIDTLELGADLGYGETAESQDNGTGISGFEVLRLSADVDVDARALSNNAGLAAVIAEGAGSYTESAITSLTQLGTGAFEAELATDGSEDSLTLTLGSLAGVKSTLTAAEMETITVVSGGLGTNELEMSATDAADLAEVSVSGTTSITIDVAGAKLATVDASGVSGLGRVFTLEASESEADMTVTGSAVVASDEEADEANIITTGDGDDTITTGAYIDDITSGNGDDTISADEGNNVIDSGRGDDTITAGDGDNDIDASNDDDTVTVGDGDNVIDLGSGDDILTAGDGDNTITLDSGDDTVTTGSGDDVVIMSDYDDDDVLDLGTGTNVLLRDALPTTGAYAASADFVDVSGDIEPQFSNIDAVYLQHSTATANDGEASLETLDFTNSTGLGALYLDIRDGEADDDAVYTITEFDGSQLHLSQVDGETDGSPATMNIGGTGQSSLTIKTYDFNNGEDDTDLVITQVDSLTVDTYETVTVSGVTSEVTNTVLGTITADDADSVTVGVDGIAASLGTVTFTTGNISADGAQTLTFSAGSNSELVTGAIESTSESIEALSLTADDDGVLDITSIAMVGSDLDTLTVTAGIGARIDLDGASDTMPITADSVTAATFTLGAASFSAFDLLYGGTTSIAMTTGSTLDLDDIGVADTVSSTTITGRGTLRGDLDLLGTATFKFSGFTSTGGALTIDGNSDGDKTVIGNDENNTLNTGAGEDSVTGGAGDDTISTRAGDDTIIAGNGANEITGGAGADNMTGGSDVDTYIINTVVGTSSDSDAVAGEAGAGEAADATGQDTINGFEASEDILKIVATNVTDFNHTTDLHVGAGEADDPGADGLASAYVVNTLLLDMDGTGEAGEGENFDDIVINFPTFLLNGESVYGEDDFLATTDIDQSIQYDLTGSAEDDTIVAGDLADTISGGAGEDTITGGAGDDIISLGAEDTEADVVNIAFGGEGEDTISEFEAGAGGDIITFTGDSDVVDGDAEGDLDADAFLVYAAGGEDYTVVGGLVVFDNGEAVANLTELTEDAIATRMNNLSGEDGGEVTVSFDDALDVAYGVMTDGEDSVLFQFSDADADGIDAEDIVLIGVISGVGDTGAFSEDNFANFAAPA